MGERHNAILLIYSTAPKAVNLDCSYKTGNVAAFIHPNVIASLNQARVCPAFWSSSPKRFLCENDMPCRGIGLNIWYSNALSIDFMSFYQIRLKVETCCRIQQRDWCFLVRALWGIHVQQIACCRHEHKFPDRREPCWRYENKALKLILFVPSRVPCKKHMGSLNLSFLSHLFHASLVKLLANDW